MSWYAEVKGELAIRADDRMFIRCEGGPSMSRLETFPPRLEIEEQEGTYVLEDDGPPEEWRYLFVPNAL